MQSSLSLNAPARRYALHAMFAANAISITGNRLAMLAIPWFVLSTTGSTVQTGITAFFTFLPVVLAGFFGGALIDRLGYKRASIVADLASGATIALIPLLYWLNMLPFGVLLLLVFLSALLDTPGTTAREALVPELAPLAQVSLERASSWLQIVERGAALVGAPLAGLLITLLGPQQVLWIDAATFGVSALLIGAAVPRAQPAPPAKGSYLAEMRAGLGFIRRDRLTMTLVLILVVTNFLDAAKASVIMPVLASQVYGSATALGLMFGVSGGGAVLGALLFASFGQRLSRRWVFVCGFIVVSLPMCVLTLLPPLPVVLAMQAIAGLAAGPLNPILGALQFERVPAEMRGRVFGAITAGAWAAMPLGVLLAGYLLEWAGLRSTLLVAGACYLLTTASLLFNPALREMDARPATSS